MAEIRKVSQLNEIPGYVSAAFFGEEEETDFGGNRYASLKENSVGRRSIISKEQKAWEQERSASTKRQSWERDDSPSDDDSMAQFLKKFQSRGASRIVQDTDDYNSGYRPNPSNNLNDPVNFFNAGGGIFGDLESAVAEGMDREMGKRVAKSQFKHNEAYNQALEEERKNQYKKVLRGRQEVLAHGNALMANRAKAIFRNGEDEAIGSSFGMMDMHSVMAREEQRVRMAENNRQERLRIRRDTGEELTNNNNKDWEDNINYGRQSYQDADLGWVDFIPYGHSEGFERD